MILTKNSKSKEDKKNKHPKTRRFKRNNVVNGKFKLLMVEIIF